MPPNALRYISNKESHMLVFTKRKIFSKIRKFKRSAKLYFSKILHISLDCCRTMINYRLVF